MTSRSARVLEPVPGHEHWQDVPRTLDVSPASEAATPFGAPDVHLLAADDPQWDVVVGWGRGSVFHTAGYHRCASAFDGGRPFMAVIGDERQGLAWPLLLRPIGEDSDRTCGSALDVSSVYAYPGPISWGCRPGSAFLGHALDLIVEIWRAHGVVSAFTRFNPLMSNSRLLADVPGPNASAWASGLVDRGTTVSVDTSEDLAAQRRQYKRGLARDIDKARRAGMQTVVDDDWSYLPQFASLYLSDMTRLGADAYYFLDQDNLDRLRRNLGDAAHLLVTLLDGRVAAAGIFLDSQDRLEYYLSCSDPVLRGTKVLLEDASLVARDLGFSTLHLGGGLGGRDDSLRWFKGRFSPLQNQFVIGGWIVDEAAYRDLTEQREASLPPGTVLDEAFFPAYRGAPREVQEDGTDQAEAEAVSWPTLVAGMAGNQGLADPRVL